MTEEQLRFHIEEYKALRAEIAAYVKYSFDFFLYAAIASGAIAAWLLTHGAELAGLSPGVARGAAFIPFMISLIAYLFTRHLIFIVDRTAMYCSKFEAAAAIPGLGWETHLRSGSAPVPLVIALTHHMSWVVLIGANFFFALYL